ncbi:MAG TPA: cache domain-containing protein, partial [Ruminiclostridium sp.]|nr:cache domain-containing protein [Ruminiclostridium sp.]
MLKKKSIGTKITLLISIMVLAAFILMSVLTYSMSSSSLEKSIIQNMQAQAKNSSEILSEKLSSSKNMAGEIVSKDEVKSMDWNLAQSVLYEDASNTDMVKIGISDRSGATNFSDGSAADFKDKEFFKDAVSGNTVISEPFKDASGKLVIYIATPIVDGVLAKGVLICVFDGQYLSKLCSNINVGSTGSAFILSSDGTMIGNKDQSLVAKGENTIKQGKTDSSLKELSNIEAKMVKGTEGTSTYTYKGQSKYISYSPVAGTTWSLAITADKNDVLSQIDTLRLESFLFTAIFVIALVFASILIIRRVVTKPLTKAVSLLQELSKGHLGQRLEINTDDEVGKMAKAMNELADTLQLRVLDTMRKISNGESTSEIEMK